MVFHFGTSALAEVDPMAEVDPNEPKPYEWFELEIRARRIGLFDEANYAREKQHAKEHGYPFLALRGFQTTGNVVMVKSEPIIFTPRAIPVATTPPVEQKPRLTQLSLFDFK